MVCVLYFNKTVLKMHPWLRVLSLEHLLLLLQSQTKKHQIKVLQMLLKNYKEKRGNVNVKNNNG